MVNRDLLSAIAVSIGTGFAVYTCMTTSRDVPNSVIALVVLLSVASAAYFWFVWWHQLWSDRLRDLREEISDLQEQINDMRMDMINSNPARQLVQRLAEQQQKQQQDGETRIRRIK